MSVCLIAFLVFFFFYRPTRTLCEYDGCAWLYKTTAVRENCVADAATQELRCTTRSTAHRGIYKHAVGYGLTMPQLAHSSKTHTWTEMVALSRFRHNHRRTAALKARLY